MTASESDPAAQAARELPVCAPDRVGVATSGGPDSLAALVLIARACADKCVPVFALHVEHGLRPHAAAAERELVRRVAESVGAGFATRAIDVAAARSCGGSLEFVARELRHAALDDMAASLRLSHVVLAHHEADQVETVILALLRGAWPAALAGIPGERRMPGGALLVRPFLRIPRAALRAHAAALQPAEDEMNLDPAHRRVAVREHLLPALRACDPGVDGIVLALAAEARGIDELASRAAARLLGSDAVYAEPGVLLIDAPALRSAGRFAAARLLKTACDRDPELGLPSWALVRRIEYAASIAGPWLVHARRGVAVSARAGVVALFSTSPRQRADHALTWRGAPLRAPLDAVRTLRVDPLAPGDAPPPDSMACHLEPGVRIGVRPRAPKDRFRLGPQGSKLVSDELCDQKVQPAWRPRVPLVFVGGDLRWIAGIRRIKAEGEPPPNAVFSLEGPTPWSRPYRKATT